MWRSWTHEEYLAKLNEKGIEIIPLENYIDSRTPIKHKCPKHGTVWNTAPNWVLSGRGCYKCGLEKRTKSRRRTTEQYKAELLEKGIQAIPLEEYISITTPINHKCLIHNVDWVTTPQRVLIGNGCPQCAREKRHAARTKTNEEYLQELASNGVSIKPLEDYAGADTPILHRCLNHNYDWKTRPIDVLKGKGCPMCRREKIHDAQIKPEADYIKELAEKNPNAILIGKYNGANRPALHKCIKHNYEWMPMPSTLLNGSGCPICAREKVSASNRRTNEQYISELKEKNSTVIPVEDYKGVKVPIMHRCLIHNHDWVTSPASVLAGKGCPLCHGERIRAARTKTNEQYVEELKNITQDIIPLEDYKGANTPILHLCKKHNVEWNVYPGSVLHGHGCPQCRASHGESRVKEWLDSHNITYKTQKTFPDCKDKHVLPFDIFIPSMNAIIEYDGAQHYKPVEWFGGEEAYNILKRHDEIKTNYCLQNGIKLLRIPYYKNVEKELDSFIYNS